MILLESMCTAEYFIQHPEKMENFSDVKVLTKAFQTRLKNKILSISSKKLAIIF